MKQGFRIDEGRTLNPGLLARHRITWQRKEVSEQNSFGEDVYTWADVASMPAQIRQPSGRELESLQQRWSEARYEINHYFFSGLETVMRIAWTEGGVTKYLDPLDIADRAGTRRITTVIAKEWQE